MSNKNNSPKCTRCGRTLTDPVSIAIGMGPGCRGTGKPRTKRQRLISSRILRGQSYSNKSPIQFAGNVFTFEKDNNVWKSASTSILRSDEEMKAMLEKYKAIIMPADYISCLEERRNRILSAMKTETFTSEQTQELNQELEEIEKQIENI